MSETAAILPQVRKSVVSVSGVARGLRQGYKT